MCDGYTPFLFGFPHTPPQITPLGGPDLLRRDPGQSQNRLGRTKSSSLAFMRSKSRFCFRSGCLWKPQNSVFVKDIPQKSPVPQKFVAHAFGTLMVLFSMPIWPPCRKCAAISEVWEALCKPICQTAFLACIWKVPHYCLHSDSDTFRDPKNVILLRTSLKNQHFLIQCMTTASDCLFCTVWDPVWSPKLLLNCLSEVRD